MSDLHIRLDVGVGGDGERGWRVMVAADGLRQRAGLVGIRVGEALLAPSGGQWNDTTLLFSYRPGDFPFAC